MIGIVLILMMCCYCEPIENSSVISFGPPEGNEFELKNRTGRSYTNAIDIFLTNGKKDVVSVNVSLLGSVLHLKYLVNESGIHSKLQDVHTPVEVKKLEVSNSTKEQEDSEGNGTQENAMLGKTERLERHRSCATECRTMDEVVGSCYSREDCYRRGGNNRGPCCGSKVCCTFEYSCGDISAEEITHFRSPGYPSRSTGSIACDFDLVIRSNVCAVRVDYAKTVMVGRLGGVCDVDQVLIINAADGPTVSHCGDLAGYSTTIAVSPGQIKPLKVVAIMQNEAEYMWNIRLKQMLCTDLAHFKKPYVCGSKAKLEPTYSFYNFLDLWKNMQWYPEGDYMNHVWWSFPSPVFNRYYYGSSKRILQQSLSTQGASQSLAQDRIIQGTDAEMHEFPWQAAIVLRDMFFCGGALISEEFVLSAAHCFLTRDTPVTDLGVFLGDHDLTVSNETQHTVRGVRRIHFHSHFHALLLSNDIAMLQLDRTVAFSHRIRPVCLPFLGETHTGEEAMVTGWGITTFPDGSPSAQLQKLQVQIISNDECEVAIDEELGIGNLCAVPNGLQGTCFGDSGGPLTIDNEGQETLIGIISFGVTGCAMLPGFPDLYTRISEYLKWIDVSALVLD